MSDQKKDRPAPVVPPVAASTDELSEPDRKPKTILRPPFDKMARPGLLRRYQTK